MPFISYAQNLEDAVLHRALGEIKNGFYVDVDANDLGQPEGVRLGLPLRVAYPAPFGLPLQQN